METYEQLIDQLPNDTLLNNCLKCYYNINLDCDECRKYWRNIKRPSQSTNKLYKIVGTKTI